MGRLCACLTLLLKLSLDMGPASAQTPQKDWLFVARSDEITDEIGYFLAISETGGTSGAQCRYPDQGKRTLIIRCDTEIVSILVNFNCPLEYDITKINGNEYETVAVEYRLDRNIPFSLPTLTEGRDRTITDTPFGGDIIRQLRDSSSLVVRAEGANREGPQTVRFDMRGFRAQEAQMAACPAWPTQ